MTTSFYRPAVARTPRSMRRKASARRAVTLVIFIFVLGGSVGAAVLGIRFHPRFVVRRVVLEGVPETRRSEAEELTDVWIGKPLLFADIDTPMAQLSARAWVAQVTVRRVVPDTVIVRLKSRPPVALAQRNGELWTVDRAGSWLGAYSGRGITASDDFVVIDPGQDSGAAADSRVARATAFLERLKLDDPALLARLSELEVQKNDFGAIDKVAHVHLLFGPDALEPGRASTSWRAFLALAPELERHSLLGSSADLRFTDRIVLKAPAEEAGRGKT